MTDPVLKLASWARPAIWSIDGSVMPWNSGTARRASDRLVMAAPSRWSGDGRRPDPPIRSSTFMVTALWWRKRLSLRERGAQRGQDLIPGEGDLERVAVDGPQFCHC